MYTQQTPDTNNSFRQSLCTQSSSGVLQATPHIVGLISSVLGHRLCLITPGHNTLHVRALSPFLMVTSRDSSNHLGHVQIDQHSQLGSNQQASTSRDPLAPDSSTPAFFFRYTTIMNATPIIQLRRQRSTTRHLHTCDALNLSYQRTFFSAHGFPVLLPTTPDSTPRFLTGDSGQWNDPASRPNGTNRGHGVPSNPQVGTRCKHTEPDSTDTYIAFPPRQAHVRTS